MEQVKDSSIYYKLVGVQEQLKTPKDNFNSFGGYSYRSAESILKAAKPLLAQAGLAVVMTDEVVEVAGRVYVRATATLIDVESGATISATAYAREQLDKRGMDQAQVTGSASSYARKYALQGLLALSDASDDPDTKDNRDQGQRPQNGQQQPQQRQQNGQQRPAQRQSQPQGAPQRQQGQQPPAQQQRPLQQPPQQPAQRPQAVQQPQRQPLPDPVEDLKAGVRTKVLHEKIRAVIDRHPERNLLQQIKTMYKVQALDDLTEQLAQKCLATLERCEKAWAQGGAA